MIHVSKSASISISFEMPNNSCVKLAFSDNFLCLEFFLLLSTYQEYYKKTNNKVRAIKHLREYTQGLFSYHHYFDQSNPSRLGLRDAKFLIEEELSWSHGQDVLS